MNKKLSLKILHKNFSIKYEHSNNIHKIITIFGIKIKINMGDITCINYSKLKKEIKYKKNKIRIIFLSTENSKWSYQNLYEYLKKDPRFEPIVVVSILYGAHIGNDHTRSNPEETYNFFKSNNIDVEYAYKKGEYINLKTFSPDIVFYEQPWEIPEQYRPNKISKYALTCYVSYSFQGLFDDKGIDYLNEFHKYLFQYFISNKYYTKLLNKKNTLYLGYPKLDTYFDNYNIDKKKIWKDPTKIKIIYAPHHSFESEGLKTATFNQNGKLILEIAKNHPETTWIFKPHPRFKLALLHNNIMNEKEIEEYYNQWSQIGIIYDKGNYFDIFKTSDMMITDCCSFLAEYLPSKHPLIQLVNKNSVCFTDIGRKIIKGYYQCSDWTSLENMIINLENPKNDFKLSLREKIIPKIIDLNEKSSYKIYKYLKKITNKR